MMEVIINLLGQEPISDKSSRFHQAAIVLDELETSYYVAKNRHGKSGFTFEKSEGALEAFLETPAMFDAIV